MKNGASAGGTGLSVTPCPAGPLVVFRSSRRGSGTAGVRRARQGERRSRRTGEAGGEVREGGMDGTPSNGLDTGFREPEEFGTDDGSHVLGRVLGKDSEQVDRDLDERSEQEHAELVVPVDLDAAFQPLDDQTSKCLPIGVAERERAVRRLDAGDENAVVVCHGLQVVGSGWLSSFRARLK